MTILPNLLTTTTTLTNPTLGEWRAVHEQARAAYTRPIDAAMAAAAQADRLAWVFASGYTEAVRALVAPARNLDGVVSLCVTEADGNSPKAIETRLNSGANMVSGTMSGTKTMVSGGPWADWFVVLASRGEDEDGMKKLSLVVVPSDRDGIIIEELDPLPIVPEMPHAIVRFDEVRVEAEDVISDDAWTEYVRPFRVVEDLYVYAALVAWMTVQARRSGQLELVHRFVALVAAARDLAAASSHADATVSGLAGLRAMGRETLEAFDWSSVDDEFRERWERDRGLLGVASKARRRRLSLVESRIAGA
ncbi:acyl-CoA dehydrogenase [Persicimonas caeni]|uniref:Acyl-CoA dehydrogenase n=1 Tax=Persicimonas caeni TaxID=2292766 RepID=A0A4Y6PZB3_PERCE|nr:acyl-CoA dehydrogenase family protein [Persicimonas caeni]QDG53509.1 acyl-CoA dehydrogenase [Persicimonas caeni]QED34730.1 acyl-CoA dehydrogenase [Persicimonas caeni]